MIINLILVLIFSEFIIYFLFKNLKKDFQWIIGLEDLNPIFKSSKFNNFLKNSFDKNLGWDRKASSKGFEKSNKKTYFFINKSGSRGKRIYSKDKIAVFGDSFAFCRYVNDNETWEYLLSKNISSNVLNYGVGNYGLDQAYLKYKNNEKKIKAKHIIFCVVPETIARIHSYWKHYREFGNIFAFKPLIVFKDGKENIIKIPLLKTKKLNNGYSIFSKNFLNKIKDKDIFFKYKFKKTLLKFPYSIYFIKNVYLYFPVFYYLILYKFFSKKKIEYYDLARKIVLINNIKQSHFYYKDYKYVDKLSDLIQCINLYFTRKKKTFTILIIPQYLDIYLNKSNKEYINYFKSLNKNFIIDLTKDIKREKNWKKFYLKDKYGGHLSKLGNQYVSRILKKKLKNII